MPCYYKNPSELKIRDVETGELRATLILPISLIEEKCSKI